MSFRLTFNYRTLEIGNGRDAEGSVAEEGWLVFLSGSGISSMCNLYIYLSLQGGVGCDRNSMRMLPDGYEYRQGLTSGDEREKAQFIYMDI